MCLWVITLHKAVLSNDLLHDIEESGRFWEPEESRNRILIHIFRSLVSVVITVTIAIARCCFLVPNNRFDWDLDPIRAEEQFWINHVINRLDLLFHFFHLHVVFSLFIVFEFIFLRFGLHYLELFLSQSRDNLSI